MKKLFLALLLFFSTSTLKAQDIFVETGNETTTLTVDGTADKSTSKSTDQSFLNSKVELGGQLSVSGAKYEGDNAAITVFTFEPYLGVKLSRGFELGFYPGLSSISSGSLSRTAYQLYLAPAYNFDAGNVYPFIEGLVGYSDSDVGLSGMGFGGRAGLKIQLGKSSLLSVGFNYVRQSLHSGSGSSYTENVGSYQFDVGFRVFL